jgi:hypothetical protein
MPIYRPEFPWIATVITASRFFFESFRLLLDALKE